MAGLWILLSFPDLQQHLKVAWVEYIANRLCRLKKLLGFSVTNKLTNIYVAMDIYSSVFKPMVYNSSDMHEDGKKGVSSGLVLRIVWSIIIDVIRF